MAAHTRSAARCIQQNNPGAGLFQQHDRTCRATDKMPKDNHGRRQICGRPVVSHVRDGFACGNYCKKHTDAQKPAEISAPVFFDE